MKQEKLDREIEVIAYIGFYLLGALEAALTVMIFYEEEAALREAVLLFLFLFALIVIGLQWWVITYD